MLVLPLSASRTLEQSSPPVVNIQGSTGCKLTPPRAGLCHHCSPSCPGPARPICFSTVLCGPWRPRPCARSGLEEHSEGREERLSNTPVRGFSLAPRTTWLALTLALGFLLLISVLVNVTLLLGSRAERSRHLDGAYVYHPLQEMNGELPATEKEQPGDICNPFKD